ncbi:MAG TPA: metal-dependent transcriptional regulator [Opitutaceae bacterium]|jgi:DtxR family Mn-dependent transcriptional regulator
MPTSTVENYLKAIAVRSSDDNPAVATGALAEALGVTPGTITTMVKSLASRGLLEHQPREGVRLTPQGRTQALAVVRKHRLVETFLVQVLKMDWKEVHEEAEALEHAISDRVLSRIDGILGHPDSDPHGDPIPSLRSPRLARSRAATLGSCDTNRALRVERILDQSPGFLEFIQRSGLKPGARVRVRERNTAGGIVRCELRDGDATLGIREASKIEVGS